jgi:hypothetical protein
MYGPQLAACGLEARAPMRCRGDGVYRCMRAQCLCTRHAGWKPAHPGGAGVMECIAVCGLDARAPRWCIAACGLEARAPRWCIAVCGLEARAPGMRARRPRSQCSRAGRGDVRSCDPAHHIQAACRTPCDVTTNISGILRRRMVRDRGNRHPVHRLADRRSPWR